MKAGAVLGLLAAFGIGGFICYRIGKAAIAAPPAIPAGITAAEFEEAKRLAAQYGVTVELVCNLIKEFRAVDPEKYMQWVEAHLVEYYAT